MLWEVSLGFGRGLVLLGFLGSELSGLDGSLLSGGLSLGALIERERMVLLADGGDLTAANHVVDEGTGDAAIDLELLDKHGASDHQNLGNLLDHSLVLLIIEEAGIIGLFLNLDLGPGLLLALDFGTLLL